MIKISIPTIKTFDQVKQQIEDIRRSVPADVEVFATCQNVSASQNRNIAINRCKDGDILVMVDDDITGYHDGWLDAIIEPIVAGASISSARLLTLTGEPGPQIGVEDRNGLEVYEAHGGAVPSAAIAFVVDDLIFDENYAGAGWEDTDFCRQKKLKYPDKQIVITNKCRLIHRLEFKHYGADTPNCAYYNNKWGNKLSLDVLIFSRNRPAQLDLLLSSIREFMPTMHNRIHVLYSYTHEMYDIGYQRVFSRYRNVAPVLQNEFMKDVRGIVNKFSKAYAVMLVDDGVFIRTPYLVDLLNAYSDDVCTVSLRMSPSAKHCTPANTDMQIPEFERVGDVYKWDYTKMYRHTDWGYPHGLDGNVFRTSTLKEMMNAIECNNPNELEARMITRIPDKPYMICGAETSWLLVSANRVAAGNTPNEGQTTESLNEAHVDGFELQNDWRGKEKVTAVNILAPYVIKKPTVGIHFHYNGVMNGCYKVWYNTILGMDKAGLPHSTCIEKYNGAINTFENMPRNTLVGPETMVLPRENYELWRKFKNFAVPCQWVKDSYLKDEATHGHNIMIWPVGVETDKWVWGKDKSRSEITGIVFNKTVNLSKETVERRTEEVMKELDECDVKTIPITYGKYQEEELLSATRKADFAVWIGGTESQNIALLEVLSAGVPVYVYDQLEQSYAGLTSAPYFDERCGRKETVPDYLPDFINDVLKYKPRDFIMEHFTVDHCARKYYQQLTECRE